MLPQATDYTDAELGLQPGDERILLMQRGPSGDPSADYNGNGDLTDDACFPGEKAAKAFDAGWDAIVLVNRHLGSDDSTGVPFCGSGGYEPGKPMVTICTTHAAYHELFGTTPEFTTPYSPDDAPAIGAISAKRVRATSVFDGWGYLSLFRRSEGKVERVDSYAIPEALDPAFAFGFGDLSIHEIATDPGRNIAYSSYYAGGMRVFRLRRRGHRGGRPLHRRRGEQLLGRRDVRARPRGGRRPGGEAPVRGLRPRPRHLHLPLHGRLTGSASEGRPAAAPRGPSPGDSAG